MVTRWSTALLAGGVLLGVGGIFLYGWSMAAGIVTHVVAGVLLFLGYRVRKSGQGLVEMAGSI